MLDPSEFAAKFEMLCAVFQTAVTEPLTEAYWACLRDMESQAFSEAVTRALATLRFMPKPGELRALSGQVLPEDRAIAAWNRARAAIGSQGSYMSVDFEDKIINAAIRSMGGWELLCASDAEEVSPWARKEFEKHYLAWLRMDPSDDHIKPLPGLIERMNPGSDFGKRTVLIECSYLRPARLALGRGR